MEIIVNDRVHLKLFNLKQIHEFFCSIHEVTNNTDQYREALQKKYPNLKDIESRVIDAIENKYAKDGTPDFFILLDNKIIGVFEIHPLTDEDHLEIGYWIYEEYRGQGILSAIFPHIINYAKTNFTKSYLLATTGVSNSISKKLLEKFDFTQESSDSTANGDLTEDIRFILHLKD